MENPDDIFTLSLREINFRVARLLEREHTMVLLLLEGKSINEIALEFRITRSAVNARIDNACNHAGVNSKFQLIALMAISEYSRRRGLVP